MSLASVWFALASTYAIHELRTRYPEGMSAEERSRRICTAKDFVGYSIYTLYMYLIYKGLNNWVATVVIAGILILNAFAFGVIGLIQLIWNLNAEKAYSAFAQEITFFFSWMIYELVEMVFFIFFWICICARNFMRQYKEMLKDYKNLSSSYTHAEINEMIQSGSLDVDAMAVDEPGQAAYMRNDDGSAFMPGQKKPDVPKEEEDENKALEKWAMTLAYPKREPARKKTGSPKSPGQRNLKSKVSPHSVVGINPIHPGDNNV